MTRRWAGLGALLLTASAAIVVAPAGAQLQLGGSVANLIALELGPPGKFERISAGVYELRVPVQVTSTDNATRLSAADGEDFKVPARGHLRKGSGLVAAPLEVATDKRSPQPLSSPIDPQLATWDQPVTRSPVTITIRQSLRGGSITARALHKIVLITLSSQAP